MPDSLKLIEVPRTPVCPYCNGEGVVKAIGLAGDDTAGQVGQCITCRGTGRPYIECITSNGIPAVLPNPGFLRALVKL